jgi:LysR family transcriptional activator of mexEF-oprN operon
MSEDRNIDLNLLRVFRELIGELNATRAAERLGVSQAAVSASLRKLRAVYGDPLFLRTQRGLRPTARAVMLQPLIGQALSIIDGIMGTDALDVGAGTPFLVRIGLSDDFEMAYGDRIVAGIRDALPSARVVFRQTNSFVAAQGLNDRDMDLAITAGGFSDGRLKHLALGSSDYLVIYDREMRPDATPIGLEEYVAREHILISYSGLTGITDDVLSEHGLRRRVRTASTHFSALPFLLRGTEAISTIPAHAARAIAKLGPFGISPCPLPFPLYAFGLSWRFDTTRSAELLQARDVVAGLFTRCPDAIGPVPRDLAAE